MRRVIVFAAWFLIGLLSSISLGATYGGGSGTAADPYLIYTPEQMNTIGANSIDWDKCFKLMADIDMSAYTDTQYKIIGNSTKKFIGTFDGNGQIIRNLTYTTTAVVNYIGLFGYTSGAVIQNLGIENIMLSTGGSYVGGLVGYNYCGSLTSSHVIGSISGQESVGGLVGCNDSGSIISSYATGSVRGMSSIGGLTGLNKYRGMVISCYATSSVNGTSSVGGLMGFNKYGGMIISCYATGLVSGTSSVGGLAGSNSGSIVSCFWDIQSSGLTTSAGGTGKTTAEMHVLSTFTNAGWDFVGESINGFHDYWQMVLDDYPRFAVHPWTLAGNGTAANPYIVATTGDLGKIWLKPSACYRLINNLDLAGVSWSVAIIPMFSGIFDGQNFVISNLTINQSAMDYVGFFGIIYIGSQIQNLCIENVNITGNFAVGGLGGKNYGLIASCSVTGSVNGGQTVGGLVGYNFDSSAIITACHATGSVGGIGSYVGGLVGYNDHGSIASSHATGTVSGGSPVGGLVGCNDYGSIVSCYATGAANGVEDIGGLVGYNYFGKLNTCSATGSVGGIGSFIGGLVGFNDQSSIISCCATGAANGVDNIGGLVGYNSGASAITSSYATGSISGKNFVGGLVGKNVGLTISNCYATGSVSGTSYYIGGLVGDNYSGTLSTCYSTGLVIGTNNYFGGLVGHNEASIISCFWDIQTSGQTTSFGGTGKTTIQMKMLSTFPSANWNFAVTWAICEGTNYPRLQWQIPAGDFACPDGVNAEDLAALSSCWLETTEAHADTDDNGSVNLNDFIKIAQQWMVTGCGTCGGADITGDGNVDQADLDLLAGQWLLEENTACKMADLDNNGKVDLADFAVFALHWLQL